MVGSDEEEAAVLDKNIDIKLRNEVPRYQAKERGVKGSSGKKKVGAYGEENLVSDYDGFDDGFDNEFADETSTDWNLRKCAAAALDVLAVRLKSDLLNVSLEP